MRIHHFLCVGFIQLILNLCPLQLRAGAPLVEKLLAPYQPQALPSMTMFQIQKELEYAGMAPNLFPSIMDLFKLNLSATEFTGRLEQMLNHPNLSTSLICPSPQFLMGTPNSTLNRNTLTPKNALATTSFLEDFQVNENVGGCCQSDPAIAVDGNGNSIVVWQDTRNDYYGAIFVQRYSQSGAKSGVNIQVNDEIGHIAYASSPAIAVDRRGNFIVAWVDTRYGENIYAQRFSGNGTKSGTNFRVNDSLSYQQPCSPSIAISDSGGFMVVWQAVRNGSSNNDIHAQRYSLDGTKSGPNFQINDDLGNYEQRTPSAAADGRGNFIIVWGDCRNGDDDIYGQRYSGNGTKMGTNFRVNDDPGKSRQEYPAIAANDSGNFIVVWQDYRDIKLLTYGQCFSKDGVKQGTNLRIDDDNRNSGKVRPAPAIDRRGNFVVVWSDYWNDEYEIFGQLYSRDQTKIGSNFRVNDDIGSNAQGTPSIAMDDQGNFFVVWQDYRNGDADIYAQRYTSNGMNQETNFRINDDFGSSSQAFPAIAVDGSGNFTVIWIDDRDIAYQDDIYAQRFKNTGEKLMINFRVNDDCEKSNQWVPAIAMDGRGNFVTVWEDNRDGWAGDIYAQRYSNNGTKLGPNFKVNDDSGNDVPWNPAIASDGNGNFVVVWQGKVNDEWNIYAQRYTSNGTKLGMNFQVNDESIYYQINPTVAMDWNGNFVVVWECDTGWANIIYLQCYSSDGTKSGENTEVNDQNRIVKHSWPAVATDGVGNFIVTWVDNRNGIDN